MSITVYVPRDSSAVSLGADAVARNIMGQALLRHASVTLIRNGSRGLFWLEPLVEVETPGGRIAYGPVRPPDGATLFEDDFLHGGEHHLRLGSTEEIAFLKNQERLTFARVGVIAPLSLDDYTAHGGYRGLRRVLEMSGPAIVQEVTDSGLRGRGGAAF